MKMRPSRLFLLALSFAAMTAAATVRAEAERKPVLVPVDELYAYDASMPLNAEIAKDEETDVYVKYRVRYRSAHDRVVPGIFAVPKKGVGPFPVVLWQHGLSNNKENHWKRAAPTLLENGYAVMLIDAEFHGERTNDLMEEGLVKYFYAFRNMMVQTVIDLKRAADFLETRPEANMDRLAYAGVSLGSFMGSAFMAQDPRPRAGIMIVGGTVEDAFPMFRAEKAYKRIHPVIESKQFIPRVAPRPLLFLNGNQDTLISKTAALAFFKAAGEPKRQIFYDAGHEIPMELMAPDILTFLDENLKPRN